MLETLDLTRSVSKSEFKDVMPDLEIRLGNLQREAKDAGIPVLVVFEGWDAAGKGTLINELLLAMDPRGFVVHPYKSASEEERLRPYLWRFWTKLPERGRIAIFDRSWYGRVLVERVEKLVPKSVWSRAYDDIRSFERQLADDRAAIVKFFLHISPSEQKKRFKKLENNPATAWRVNKDDWKRHRQYGDYLEAVEEMLARTDADFAPWTVVEAHDRRFAIVKVFQTVIAALEGALRDRRGRAAPTESRRESDPLPINVSSSILGQIDLTLSLEREAYEKELRLCQARLRELEHEVYRRRIPVVIVYEGSDAAGKGGNIKRLVRGMDPRGYEVIPIAAPNDTEKAHHYLWRFWRSLPKGGHIAIFDRSWYGRVLVERVEGFCRENEWKRAYREINEMERQLADAGSSILKFWIQIGKEEQLRRFEERQNTPAKQWKITEEDWRNREKWDAYCMAVDEMLYRTSTAYAPWTVVEGDCKLHARIKVMKKVIEEIEKRL
ncbi:MAG: Thymidylate kinase [candidate division BRC1 bacterium ADurb.BinA364]|nr:MAG: Thymidylate kinase [candidate division BRC1 bacterium ADurb.BinA364]